MQMLFTENLAVRRFSVACGKSNDAKALGGEIIRLLLQAGYIDSDILVRQRHGIAHR